MEIYGRAPADSFFEASADRSLFHNGFEDLLELGGSDINVVPQKLPSAMRG